MSWKDKGRQHQNTRFCWYTFAIYPNLSFYFSEFLFLNIFENSLQNTLFDEILGRTDSLYWTQINEHIFGYYLFIYNLCKMNRIWQKMLGYVSTFLFMYVWKVFV